MKMNLIKIISVCLFSVMITACKTVAPASETLPKDISERPADDESKKYDQAQLDILKSAIDSEIAKEKCTDAKEWAFAPIGAKACGGPYSYIAYPKKNKESILAKLENFKNMMIAHNKKYNLSSDCMLPAEPVSIRCEAGKAVLVYP